MIPVLRLKKTKEKDANTSKPPNIKSNLTNTQTEKININHKKKNIINNNDQYNNNNNNKNENSETAFSNNPGENEIAKLQLKNFDYAFYLKKIQHKILISLKDTNFLIADRSMVIFKNEKIIAQFISSKLDSKLIDNLIHNIRFHWSQDIKMISNLVIIKVISSFPETLGNLSEENKKYIQAINNLKAQNEDIWDIQFNLKAD